MEPRKLTARLAAHLDAIERARERGITWGELATALGARSAPAVRAAVARARAAVEAGRIKPGEQLPLPDPAPEQPPKETKPGEPIPRATGRKFFDSLPQIGGKS